jgi:hypothetical protein
VKFKGAYKNFFSDFLATIADEEWLNDHDVIRILSRDNRDMRNLYKKWPGDWSSYNLVDMTSIIPRANRSGLPLLVPTQVL